MPVSASALCCFCFIKHVRNYHAALWCAEHNYPNPLYGVEEDCAEKEQNNVIHKAVYGN
jgi:hypothetical protein